MKKLLSDCKIAVLGLLVALASASVFADRVYQADGLAVRLGEKACSDKKVLVVTKMAEDGLGIGKQNWKEATVVYMGEKFKACYAENDGPEILMVDESGDGGLLPKALFKPGKQS